MTAEIVCCVCTHKFGLVGALKSVSCPTFRKLRKTAQSSTDSLIETLISRVWILSTNWSCVVRDARVWRVQFRKVERWKTQEHFNFLEFNIFMKIDILQDLVVFRHRRNVSRLTKHQPPRLMKSIPYDFVIKIADAFFASMESESKKPKKRRRKKAKRMDSDSDGFKVFEINIVFIIAFRNLERGRWPQQFHQIDSGREVQSLPREERRSLSDAGCRIWRHINLEITKYKILIIAKLTCFSKLIDAGRYGRLHNRESDQWHRYWWKMRGKHWTKARRSTRYIFRSMWLVVNTNVFPFQNEFNPYLWVLPGVKLKSVHLVVKTTIQFTLWLVPNKGGKKLKDINPYR